MSEDYSASGEIVIVPPIPWSELSQERWALKPDGSGTYSRSEYPKAYVRVETEDVDTPEGVMQKRTGVAIVPSDWIDYDIDEAIQAIVDRFAAGRTFTGHIETVWAGSDDPTESMNRYVVLRDGRVVRLTPTITWPEDAS